MLACDYMGHAIWRCLKYSFNAMQLHEHDSSGSVGELGPQYLRHVTHTLLTIVVSCLAPFSLLLPLLPPLPFRSRFVV